MPGPSGQNALTSTIGQFAGHKYLNLETYRKSDAAVCTPVWFAERNGKLHLYTLADSAKVKRIRNNPRVRPVPSDLGGNRLGELREGQSPVMNVVRLSAKGAALETSTVARLWRSSPL